MFKKSAGEMPQDKLQSWFFKNKQTKNKTKQNKNNQMTSEKYFANRIITAVVTSVFANE